MIQRTLFNKLTLDRIDEVFTHYFPESLPAQLERWRQELAEVSPGSRQFYISVNDQHEMDGIMLYDSTNSTGVLYARSLETVQRILERAVKTEQLTAVEGDSKAVEWAHATNLLAK